MEYQAVNAQGFITVIGAVNVDIAGTSFEPLITGDSNPGKVMVSLGGVGRNIAENISRLGAPIRLVTVTGEDAYGSQAEKSCHELGIDLSLSSRIQGETTSTYLCINDADGDLRVAVSDMDICRHISPSFLKERMAEINRSKLVVVDANLSREAIGYLAEYCTVPVFADPVSVKKAARLKDCLQNIYCIKPNRPEAEVLAGVTIRDNGDLSKAAQVLHAKGVTLVFISLGGEGVYYDDGQVQGIIPCYPGGIVNTTGCGDAFMAAVSCGYFLDETTISMARMGLAAAALCAGVQEAVCKELSSDLLRQKLNEVGGKA